MLKKSIKSLFFYIITIIIALLQISCNANGVGTSNNSLPNSLKNISLGSVATIPVLNGVSAVTTMVVDNNVGENLKLISANILHNNKIIDALHPNSFADVTSCSNLYINASCPVAISPSGLSGSFIIKMVYADVNGIKYTGVQIINYSSEVHQENGFVYFTPDILPLDYGRHTLTIPVILENNYSKISVALDNLPDNKTSIQCPDGKYIANTMCTVYVTYNTTGENNLSPRLLISGIKPLKSRQFQFRDMGSNDVFIQLRFSNSGAANLVVSAPNIQATVGSSTQVTMLNNGIATATNISYNGLTPITATTSGGTCTSTLAAGSTCTFNISVSSSITGSGYGSAVILYSNGIGQLESIPFNVYYFPMTTTPALTLSSNAWLVDTLVNSISYQGIYVANTGTATLNNLQFSNVTNQVLGMSYGGNGQSCVNGQSLAPNNSCVLVISYAPVNSVAYNTSTTVNISPTASYIDLSGNQASYIGSSLSMQYSANVPGTNLANYIVAGDYGAVTANLGTAVITGATGWSVKNNTPFTTTGVTISRMVNNGNLQVAGTGGTAAGAGFIYQAPNGLIWEKANVGGVPPSGATANAITGLTYDSVNGYLVTNNTNTNVYSTALLNKSGTTWATRAAFTTSFAFNLFNFFDGSSWSYFAPQNTATAGRQLAVSKTPTSAAWTEVNTSGAARTYVSTIYDGSRYCTLSSTKFVSCANSAGFTTGSTWTQNTTAISSSTASTMFTNNGSSSYIALNTTAPFVVYLSSPANPASAGTWTSATTQPSSALAWADYGAGQYVAVSNAATGLVWTSPTGSVWTQRTSGSANNPANEPYGFIYYDGNNYWASGTTVLRVSPDGINWSNAGIQSLTFLYNGNTLTYLAAGTAGAIESSTNLNTWSGVNSTTSAKLNYITCFNSNNCFAVGESGTILFSSDGAGAVWSSQVSGTTNGLNSVACGYTNCVVVGNNGLILTESINSTIWSSQTVGTNNLNSVTFSNIYNRYVAVGNAGVIYTSSDGINWVNENTNTAYNLTSVKCAVSVIGCMAVGNVVATPTAGTVLTSANGLSWTAQTNTTGSNMEVGFYNGNWVVAQGTSTVGGTIRSAPDIFPLVWTAAKTSNITAASTMNFNAVLAY